MGQGPELRARGLCSTVSMMGPPAHLAHFPVSAVLSKRKVLQPKDVPLSHLPDCQTHRPQWQNLSLLSQGEAGLGWARHSTNFLVFTQPTLVEEHSTSSHQGKQSSRSLR